MNNSRYIRLHVCYFKDFILSALGALTHRIRKQFWVPGVKSPPNPSPQHISSYESLVQCNVVAWPFTVAVILFHFLSFSTRLKWNNNQMQRLVWTLSSSSSQLGKYLRGWEELHLSSKEKFSLCPTELKFKNWLITIKFNKNLHGTQQKFGPLNWHKGSAFRRSIGNDVSGHYNDHYFLHHITPQNSILPSWTAYNPPGQHIPPLNIKV